MGKLNNDKFISKNRTKKQSYQESSESDEDYLSLEYEEKVRF
jgi:hypothetical protein